MYLGYFCIGQSWLAPKRYLEPLYAIHVSWPNHRSSILYLECWFTGLGRTVRHPSSLSPWSLTSGFYRYIIITEKDIDAQLLTSLGGSPPLDILVQTSGVKRLSDFMLWKVSVNSITYLLLSSKPERCYLVLRRYPTPILSHILARFRVIWLYSNHPRLSYFSVQAEVSKESHELPLLQQCRLCFHFMLPALQPNHTELEHHKMLLLYQLYMYIILVVSSCSNRPSFPAPLQNAKIPVEKRGTTNKTTWWKRRSKVNLLKAAINYVNPTGWKSEFGKETKMDECSWDDDLRRGERQLNEIKIWRERESTIMMGYW